MATANYLCYKNAVQTVPNGILGKVTNFGFPNVFHKRIATTKMQVGAGGAVWIGLKNVILKAVLLSTVK